MSFDLDSLAAKRVVTTVEFMGQSAQVTYNPAALTAEKYNASQTDDQGFTAFFTELVTDWDVRKGGKKVPLTLKGLEGVPLQFLRAVFSHIMADKEADPDQGNSSSGTSRRKGTTAKRRTGTA